MYNSVWHLNFVGKYILSQYKVYYYYYQSVNAYTDDK